MNRAAAVRARGITKAFGDIVALDGVDVDVAGGRVHGLVGPNGAGKTTMLGLLLGLSVADSGTLEVLGTPAPDTRAIPDGVAGFVDGPGLYPWLTARKNLSALTHLGGHVTDRAWAVDEVLEQVGLGAVADERVRGFSLGMRQRLGLAAALLTRPRLLVLDEPTNGLDPAGKHHVHRVIRQLADEGAAVILSSHRMEDLEAVCSEVSILALGRVVFSGPLSKLASECGELDYRLTSSDAATARRVAADNPGLRVLRTSDYPSGSDAIVVRGAVPALDELVARLVHAGVAVRGLTPVVSPLEAAFLSLTEGAVSETGVSVEGVR